MLSYYIKNQIPSDNPAMNTVADLTGDNKVQRYSLVLCSALDDKLQNQLEQHFNVFAVSTKTEFGKFDAALIDCRGKTIDYPLDDSLNNASMVLILIDAHSIWKEPLSDKFTSELNRIELVSAAELLSPTIKLRLDARMSSLSKAEQVSLVHKAARQNYNQVASEVGGATTNSSNHVDQNVLQENAFEVLQAVLQNTTDWMVVKDLEHRFIAASPLFLNFHKKTLDEVIGKNDLELGTEAELVLGNPDKEWKGYWQLDDEVIADGNPNYFENQIVQETALEQVHEQVAKVPLRDRHGQIFGLLVCVTKLHTKSENSNDVTSIVSRHNIEISPIIGTLNDQRRKAEALSKRTQSAFNRKNNFIATASHDLRQPLHAIGLLIESLENKIIDAEQRSTLGKIKQSSKDLNNLLNSILDISKLDADAVKVTKNHFNIAPLLKSIEDEFGTEAKQKGLKLHINNSSAIVFTDSLLLIRIIRNLVSNAVKHTLAGNINIVTEMEHDCLLVHVKDTGPGIPKEQHQAIFGEYRRIDEQKSQPNFGMGLGLSIVKRLTDLLDVEIKLDSSKERGTRITLSIPLGDDSYHHDLHPETATSPEFGSYRVMVIEDNPVVLDAMLLMLTELNCEAYPARNIDESLEIIGELTELPDLLLVDYQLEDGVTGDMAIKRVCEAANKNLPAVIVTGNMHSDLVRKASNSAFRVLNKPVSPDVLLNTIASAINDQRQNAITDNVHA